MMLRLQKRYRKHQIPFSQRPQKTYKSHFSDAFPTFGHISASQKISTSTSFGWNFVVYWLPLLQKTTLNAVIFATLKGKNCYPTREKNAPTREHKQYAVSRSTKRRIKTLETPLFKLLTAKHQRGDGNPLLCRRQKARKKRSTSEGDMLLSCWTV